MPDEVVAPVRRTAWWRRMSGRMGTASDAFSAGMHQLAAPGRKVDDGFFDDLLEVLISADCGVELSERLVVALRDRVRREKIGRRLRSDRGAEGRDPRRHEHLRPETPPQ